MSSPFNSLNKVRKSPLTNKQFGKPNMPFRPTGFMEESELLDDVTTQIVSQKRSQTSVLPQKSDDLPSVSSSLESLASRKFMQPLHAQASPNPLGQVRKSNQQVTKAPNDLELLSTMMKRITQLEGQVSHYSKEILEKNKQIKMLEDRVSVLTKEQSNEESSSNSSYVDKLEGKCADLQEQLFDMESFLADYGMIWVGESTNKPSEINDEEPDKTPVIPNGVWAKANSFNPANSFIPDYDLIIHNVKDLNIIAGEGVSKIKKTKDGARLTMQETVPMVLYSNGMMLFSGPFRSFEDVSTQRCLRDLMDGYFPSELQKRFPDGVPIQITDRRATEYQNPRQTGVFPGVGRTLQERRVENVHTLSSASEDCDVTNDLPGPPMKLEQFLEKLPKSVIRDSKVVDVRSSIRDALAPSTGKSEHNTELVQTEQLKEIQDRMNIPQQDRPPSARDVTTIRIKSEDGKKTFVLKMKFTDTVGDLRKYIDKQKGRYGRRYDILSAFPREIHTNNKKTLQESGLTPNATLHLKPKK